MTPERTQWARSSKLRRNNLSLVIGLPFPGLVRGGVFRKAIKHTNGHNKTLSRGIYGLSVPIPVCRGCLFLDGVDVGAPGR